MSQIRRILFVCTGNSCRSAMAEGFMKAKLKKMGISDIEVESAGIAALEGLTPTEGTTSVMAEKGIDVGSHRTRMLTKEMIERADLILAMADIHRDEILYKVPEAKDKVFLLKNYGANSNDPSVNIPDPIGKPTEVYEVCRNTIEEAVERIIQKITEQK